jgi:N-acetyl-anhydromuramyl-L-alanine amidase AmpD
MTRPLFDTEYLFGLHEAGGEQLMLGAGRSGWIVFNEAIGHEPADKNGVDFSRWSSQGLGIICRLNNGFPPDGTLPHSSLYEQFARRVANFVEASSGCKIWVIGNEMNYAVERPGVQVDWSRHASTRATIPEQADPQRRGLVTRFNALPDHSTEIRTTRGATISPGEVITPEMYARCYKLCREAIHRLPGHADDQVIVGAVAPWNTQTIYAGNANGDWVQYFRDILEQLGPTQCDGFALHAFTRGGDPALITSEEKLGPPFQNYHSEFRAYTDFMAAVPEMMRTLPVYITEADEGDPWLDVNNGWVQEAYAEINGWNQQPSNQQIRSLVLYRWPTLDRWHLATKAGVLEDFRAAVNHGYRWRGSEAEVSSLASESIPQETPAKEPPPQKERRRDRERQRGDRGQREKSAADKARSEKERNERQRADREIAGKDRGENEGADPARAVDERSERERERAEREREREARQARVAPYRAQWLDDRFPSRLNAGQSVTVPITVKNNGAIPWTPGGDHPFRLGYRYYRNRRILSLGEEKDLRTEVPQTVGAGETVTINVRIALPDQPGNYTLEMDVVHEGVTWLKEQGSPVLTRWLTVEAPRRELKLDGSDQSSLPVPLFSDVSTILPRAGTPYARRGLNQIRYIVISHTGAHPRLSLERIAETHIQYGYPGIVYDFVVDINGQVFKVTNLEDVALPDQVWSEQGVNICLTGNFSVTAPPLAQLDATGRLCAWLAQNLGLAPESIVGMSELSKSESPGDSFYRGPAWKSILSRQVRLHLAAFSGSGDNTKVQELTHALEETRVQNRELQNQLKIAEDARMRLDAVHVRMQAELVELQQQMASQSVQTIGGTRIVDWTDQLPRDPSGYRPRAAQDVRFLVIHHTGVDAATPLQEIAESQRQEWPGILYDYVVDANGEIYQTQPLDQAMISDEEYFAKGIQIAFAGDFTESTPSNEQLYAGGRLIATLMERYPHLRTEQIKGLREFIPIPSPGDQWNDGQRWREMLLAAVRRTRGMVEPSEMETQLRVKTAQMEHELQVAQRSNQLLQEQKMRLQAEYQRLQTQVSERQQDAKVYVIPQPAIRNMVDQLPKHPTLRYERRPLSQITHLAIHHTATPLNVSPTRIAELHVAPDSNRGKEAWPGIGYHYFIHADGAIDQTNLLETASFHVHRHNIYSVGIVFAGSFMNGKIPTSAQLRSGAHLTAWLMQELNVPLARVWGHREFPDNTTVCPGSEWTLGNRWRDLLFERIEQIQAGVGVKSVRHYMLFWQRQYPGPLARQDLINSINYIVRFRPAIGFSLNDARNAEYVTIVGSEAGISAAEEKSLQNSGCKVERIAGRDEEETSRMLSELANLGRRFRNFDVDF